jgi:hypothetical protein
VRPKTAQPARWNTGILPAHLNMRARSPPKALHFRDVGRRHGMRHMAIPLAAATQGCIFAEAAPPPDAVAYRTSVARALNYYEGGEKKYLISTPWQGLPGRLTVCTREEIVDSRGNKTETGPMTIYEIEGGRIIDSREDDTCLYSVYGPLQPIKRQPASHLFWPWPPSGGLAFSCEPTGAASRLGFQKFRQAWRTANQPAVQPLRTDPRPALAVLCAWAFFCDAPRAGGSVRSQLPG